jgi:hypothetical protein
MAGCGSEDSTNCNTRRDWGGDILRSDHVAVIDLADAFVSITAPAPRGDRRFSSERVNLGRDRLPLGRVVAK